MIQHSERLYLQVGASVRLRVNTSERGRTRRAYTGERRCAVSLHGVSPHTPDIPRGTSLLPSWWARIESGHSDPRKRCSSSTSHHPSHHLKSLFSIQGLCWAVPSPWRLLTSSFNRKSCSQPLNFCSRWLLLEKTDPKSRTPSWVLSPQPAMCQARELSSVLSKTSREQLHV